jgi:hypothetical protein
MAVGLDRIQYITLLFIFAAPAWGRTTRFVKFTQPTFYCSSVISLPADDSNFLSRNQSLERGRYGRNSSCIREYFPRDECDVSCPASGSTRYRQEEARDRREAAHHRPLSDLRRVRLRIAGVHLSKTHSQLSLHRRGCRPCPERRDAPVLRRIHARASRVRSQ